MNLVVVLKLFTNINEAQHELGGILAQLVYFTSSTTCSFGLINESSRVFELLTNALICLQS